MSDKYKNVVEVLSAIENLDQQSQLVIWASLSEELALRSPRVFFDIFRNAIKLSYVASEDQANFATIASAVFLSLKDDLLSGSLATKALKNFIKPISTKDGGYDN